MVQTFSKTYEQLFTTSARYILLWGGRARGGSHTATEYFLHLLTRPEYFRGFLLREVFGDIRESLWQDLKDRIEENQTINPKSIELNESRMKALCRSTGNTILSKGFKKSGKARTAKMKSIAGATHVIIEEADEISEADFKQLDDTLRSIKANIKIILIFNPPSKRHWIWARWFNLIDIMAEEFNELYGTNVKPGESSGYFRAYPKKMTNLLSIFSTYEDNIANLNESSIANYEQYLIDDPEHYFTMVKGLISEGVRGRIYKNWKPIGTMPDIWRKFYGLDWGFSVDPLALVECEVHGRNLYVRQIIYGTGILNDELDQLLTEAGVSKGAPIVYDPSNPKDGEDMRRRGWNFIKARGGQGSVQSTINFIKQFDVFLTEDSQEFWDENANYAYALDQHKNPTRDPEDKHNHAMDALGYAMDRVRVKSAGIKVVK